MTKKLKPYAAFVRFAIGMREQREEAGLFELVATWQATTEDGSSVLISLTVTEGGVKLITPHGSAEFPGAEAKRLIDDHMDVEVDPGE